MEDSKSKIVDKIKKLFRLATSPNEHEAALALAKAMEMMEKYNIDASEVKDDPFTKRSFVHGTRYNEYEHYIVALLSQFFHVKLVHIVLPAGISKHLMSSVTGKRFGNKYDVYGKEHHIIVAEFVFVFLSRTFTQLWKAKRPELVSSRNRRKRRQRVMMNYFEGVYHGLASKLSAEQKAFQQQYGIVHVDDKALAKYVDSQPGVENAVHKKIGRDAGALWAGYSDGKQININKPLATSPIKQLSA